jgi:hypothetical protein
MKKAGSRKRINGIWRHWPKIPRLASSAIARGFVRPTRDLDLYHASLIERGVACRFGDDLDFDDVSPLGEVEEVAEQVRKLMGVRS